jgi:hypothetical protein
MLNKYSICLNCGHYYFLHLSNFKGECDACDDPSIPTDKKCPGFKEQKHDSKSTS